MCIRDRDYLDNGEIARIYNKLTEMENQNPLEQMRLAADNYNRYGHYMAALKNYHHVVYQMSHDYEEEMTRPVSYTHLSMRILL